MSTRVKCLGPILSEPLGLHLLEGQASLLFRNLFPKAISRPQTGSRGHRRKDSETTSEGEFLTLRLRPCHQVTVVPSEGDTSSKVAQPQRKRHFSLWSPVLLCFVDGTRPALGRPHSLVHHPPPHLNGFGKALGT